MSKSGSGRGVEQARKPRSYISRNYDRVTDQGEVKLDNDNGDQGRRKTPTVTK